jgi:hypothetical protein
MATDRDGSKMTIYSSSPGGPPSWPPHPGTGAAVSPAQPAHAADLADLPAEGQGWRAHRTTLLITALVVLIAGGGMVGMVALLGGTGTPGGKGQPAAAADTVSASSAPSPLPAAGPGDAVVSMSATGDIIMGAAPNGLPPNNGKDFFTPVRDDLRADLQMGNLEEPLTNETGAGKCPPETAGKTCFTFRSPPTYAGLLRDAGFQLMNLANNHAYDYGPDGNRQTKRALEAAGLKHTGAPGEITVAEVKGVRVAVLGFAPYTWAQSLTDIDAAVALVKKAAEQAELVVVQMHVGAEGPDKTHVKPGTEMFLGENRGDSMKFAHAVVDAGADLVIGHGPHVMRAIEFYQGRLIDYSLGNFAGYKALSTSGIVGVGGILKVSLHRDGTWAGGNLVPTRMIAPGLPSPDSRQQAWSLVRSLCASDLPQTGAHIGTDGSISPP